MAFTPIVEGLDWQALSFVNEFIKAYNERLPNREAFTPMVELEGGEDIQIVTFWTTLQTAVTEQFNSPTITTTDEDNEYQIQWVIPYDWSESPTSTAPPVKNWAQFCDYSPDMHADGFRRATTWPTDWTDLDDDAYSYGNMQIGDIIGPWIFADLQTAFDNLRTRVVTSPVPFMNGTKKTGSGSASTLYDGSGESPPVNGMVQLYNAASEEPADRPEAYHIINFNLNVQVLTRSKGTFGLWTDTSTPASGITDTGTWAVGCVDGDTVDYYWKAAGPGSAHDTFDDNGDNVTDGEWTAMQSGTVSAETAEVGSLDTEPVAIETPASPSCAQGYTTTSPYPVIRFGSLEYIK